METVLEHAVATLKTLSVFEKRYAQNVAREFLNIHRSGLTLPRLTTFHPKAPLAERLQGLLSHLPQAQLEHFSATVAVMLEDETSATSKPKPEPFVPEEIRAKLDDDSFHFADDHADPEVDEDLNVGKYASIFVEGKGWLLRSKWQHQNLGESQPQQEEESGEDVAAVAAEMPVIEERNHVLQSTDVEPISRDTTEPNPNLEAQSHSLQDGSTELADEAPETHIHELRDESAEPATKSIIGDTSQRNPTQVQQVSEDLNTTDKLADVAVADGSTSQSAEPDASSGSSDNVHDQPSGPQSSGTDVVASPHDSDDHVLSSLKAVAAQGANDQLHNNKRKAQEEPLADAEEQSQSCPPRPTKAHKTGLNDFAGAPHARPANDRYQAPVSMFTQSSERSGSGVQSHDDTSSSLGSVASDGSSGESRRDSSASHSTLATSVSSSDGGRFPGAYNFSSHDLFRKGDDPHAKRFDRGTPIPFNHQVHAFCLGNNNPDRITDPGFNAWLQIHGFDKAWLKYNFNLGVVHQYVAGTNGFQDTFYGPPNTRVTIGPPSATHGVQQATISYQQPAYGQQNQPVIQPGTQLAQATRRNKTNAGDVPPCTPEEIVRCVQNGRPKELKNNALNNFLRAYAPDMYKKTGENKAMLLKKVLNTRDVRTALQNAGLQVPVEYRVDGLAPIYNVNSIGQTMSAMSTHESHDSVGLSIADQVFDAQDHNDQNDRHAQDYQQSQSSLQYGSGFDPALSNRSRKPAASKIGGSMASQAGIHKNQPQARPTSLQRYSDSFLRAYQQEQNYGNLPPQDTLRPSHQRIKHATDNALPSLFDNGRAKNVTHVLQAQQSMYHNQPSRSNPIQGSSAADSINLDDHDHGLDVAAEPASQTHTLAPQAASFDMPLNAQPAPAGKTDDRAALSQWNNTKHGDPTKMDTIARRGGANPMLATNREPKSAAAGVSKKYQKKATGAMRVTSPQHAAQLTQAMGADFPGINSQQNSPPTADAGAGLYAAPAAPGSAFSGEQSMQNLQHDQAQFRSDDTIDLQQDEEFEEQALRNMLGQDMPDSQPFQPTINNTQPLDQMYNQYNPAFGPRPSMPQSYQPGYFNSGYADGIDPAFTFEDLINNGDGDVFYDGNA
ncbi:hypothetical protein HII31_03607 [Pseudocercospora fuligena]|uniref:Uncharacterized protein n=1 Tax=Pseudocercospora fuligena TaxID=685502 RepID=A0A8H6RQ49_9PEZI|nr:hypothetical protein HII31_03607 [Pseudocercospora fuligena]